MNVRSLIAIAAVAAAGSAFADTGLNNQETGQPDAFAPTKTRAEVQAELAQFKKDFPLSPWSYRYDPLAKFQSTASREEVRAAYIADRDEVAARNGEDSGSSYVAQSHRAPAASPTLASVEAPVQR